MVGRGGVGWEVEVLGVSCEFRGCVVVLTAKSSVAY